MKAPDDAVNEAATAADDAAAAEAADAADAEAAAADDDDIAATTESANVVSENQNGSGWICYSSEETLLTDSGEDGLTRNRCIEGLLRTDYSPLEEEGNIAAVPSIPAATPPSVVHRRMQQASVTNWVLVIGPL